MEGTPTTKTSHGVLKKTLMDPDEKLHQTQLSTPPPHPTRRHSSPAFCHNDLYLSSFPPAELPSSSFCCWLPLLWTNGHLLPLGGVTTGSDMTADSSITPGNVVGGFCLQSDLCPAVTEPRVLKVGLHGEIGKLKSLQPFSAPPPSLMCAASSSDASTLQTLVAPQNK